VLVRRGTYAWMPPLPAIPGIELSGTVVAHGPNAAEPALGQPVFVSAATCRPAPAAMPKTSPCRRERHTPCRPVARSRRRRAFRHRGAADATRRGVDEHPFRLDPARRSVPHVIGDLIIR
jgi:hypothetical protein